MLDKLPPENGEIVLHIEKQPVSVNSKNGLRKNDLKVFIKNIVSETEYYLSGDVKIEIEWYVSEQTRYESVSALDVDNIIKPLLDAISGVEGILIDDNQVQNISCSWVDIDPIESEYLIIRIRFIPREHIEKKGIYFIEYNKGFCFPLWENDPIGITKMRIETNEKLLKYRYELETKGFPYSKAKHMMPMQRVFHRSRLSEFSIVTLEDIKKKLNKP
ncbi:MAG: RusA family crossover junction endodeoxyribonuclease [Actinobacteria bacterium]|nr:RusA family crossover junction endodeoxyribonuclease [Actinomycetota bacterium]